MKRYFFILSICLIATTALYPQLNKPLRAEINVSSDIYPFALINLQKKGVLIHTAINDANKSSQLRVQDFIFYDTYLKQKWQIKTQFPIEYSVVNHALDGELLHIILRNQVYQNTITPTFLMNINLLSGAFTIDTLYSLSKIPTFTGFFHQSRVWLVQIDRSECAVNTAKIGDTIIYKYDFPKFSNQEVIDAALDTVSQKLFILYGDEYRRDEFMTLSVIDASANLLLTKKIELNKENFPVQAKLKLDKSGKLFIYGTYNLTSERQRVESDRLSTSAGFFSISFGSKSFDAEASIKLLSMQNYADFDSIDTHISPDQSQILRQKRNRRQQPFSLDILASLHLRTVDENLLLIGESVKRQYRTATQTYYDYYGRVMPYTTSVFEGYSFEDAFVWLLDSNGNPRKNYISDISMTLNSKLLMSKTAFAFSQNEPLIMFANATNVFYKTLQPYENVYQTLKLEPLHKGDKVVDDYNSRIFNWYDSHFLVCGYQTIQNNTLKGESKRIVFYLSKVSLD